MEQRWDRNLALLTDSYKFSQWDQLPDETEWTSSHTLARKGKVVLFTGLQYYLKEFLKRGVTVDQVEYANKRVTQHMGPGIFNYKGWMRIATEFNGKLPLRIRALKEGTIVPVGFPQAVCEPTHPDFAWLVDHFETLKMKVWYSTTVGTISLQAYKIIEEFLEETGDPAGIPWKLHDFGDRGTSSVESAMIGGGAHLFNFRGSDTFIANEYLFQYYGADMPSDSIPGTQHSTMTILGPDGEFKQILRFLNKFAANKIKACVLDSYNIYKAIQFIGTQKELFEKQQSMFVARPDSGDPVKMSLECVERLDIEFGHTVNAKGYKVLNTVRVIYGDGIDSPAVIRKILQNLKDHKYSADNIAFGMGGGLLQKCNRDTFGYAIKSWAAIVAGKFLKVFKDPITDPGKSSLAGLHTVRRVGDEFVCEAISKEDWEKNEGSEFQLVFEDGELFNETTHAEVIARRNETYKMYKHLL